MKVRRQTHTHARARFRCCMSTIQSFQFHPPVHSTCSTPRPTGGSPCRASPSPSAGPVGPSSSSRRSSRLTPPSWGTCAVRTLPPRRPTIIQSHVRPTKTPTETGIFAGVLWLDAAWVFRLLKRFSASLTSLLGGRDPHRRYTYMCAPSGRRPQEQQPPGPAPSAPPATAPSGGHMNGGDNGMSDATEERLLREAIRRSLEEQPWQGGGGASSGMYRPSALYVPTATVVGRDGAGGPRLPTYEEAVQPRGKRR